jgi:hypothetical protein
VNQPGTNYKVVNDLVPEVVNALQQRTDVASIAPLYIMRAIQEITESTEFEELRTTGPTVTLTANQADYPVTMFLNPGDDYTSPEVMTLYIDYPTNSVKTLLAYKTPAAIEIMTSQATQGVPGKFTRFGTNFRFGPTPYLPFSVFLRYQRRHPFPSSTDAVAIGGQRIHVPDTWEEIIVYTAALRIAIVKRWTDQAKTFHDILYGDPEYMASQGKLGRPGILAARILQAERDGRFNSRQLMVRVSRYNTY